MKLDELHIVTFGKLRDVTVRFRGDDTVIAGRNEAGKSTMLACIYALLFGTIDKRYKGSEQERVGGTLTFDDGERKMTVERFWQGKQQTVRWLNEANEEMAHPPFLDETLFRHIYSFDVHGLQQIQQMKQDDIGRFLLSASVIGSDALLRAEERAEQKLNEWFKTNGKRPKMNEQLQRLEELAQKRQRWNERLTQYEAAVHDAQQATEHIVALQRTMNEQKRTITKLEQARHIQPLIRERQQLKEKQYAPLLADGDIQLFRELSDRELRANYEANHIAEQLQQLTETTGDLAQWRMKQDELTELIGMRALYEANKWQVNEAKLTLDQLEREWHELEEQWELPSEETIWSIQSAPPFQEEARQLLKDKQRLEQERERLALAQQQAAEAVKQTEERWHHEEARVPTAEAVAHWQATVKQFERQRQQSEQATYVQQMEHDMKQSAQQQLQKWRILLLLTVLLVVSVPMALYVKFGWQQALIALFFHCALLIGLWLIKPTNVKRPLVVEASEERVTEEEWLRATQQLAKMTELKHYVERLEFQYDNAQQAMTTQQEQLAIWEQDAARYKRESQLFFQQYPTLSAALRRHFADWLATIERAKVILRERGKWIERLTEWQKVIDYVEQQAKQLSWQLNMTTTTVEPLLAKWREMERKLEQNHIRAQQVVTWEERQGANDRERELVATQLAPLQQKLQLFSIDELGEALQRQTLAVQAQDRIHEIDQQLLRYDATDVAAISPQVDYETALFTCQSDLDETMQQLAQWRDKLTAATVVKQQMEHEEEPERLRYYYEQTVAQFQTAAAQYATWGIVKQALAKAMAQYETEQLPKLQEAMTRHFTALTEGAYREVRLPREGQPFTVVRHDHLAFGAEQLSQATREQLYVALRLSLMEQQSFAMPIVIDDGFVHFDQQRFALVWQQLQTLPQQKIYFTCHSDYPRGMTVVHLA